ncbi:MAG: hypothetical protein O3B95_12155 [Chloroflexi bacterium]|nr:hypothetical protein [Chloroflexota bacterium]
MFGTQIVQTQQFDVSTIDEPVTVAVAREGSLLQKTISTLGAEAITLGFGTADIYSTRELGPESDDPLTKHEFQHMREIAEYGSGLWHSTYQIEHGYRLAEWFVGGFNGSYKEQVHDRIGKETRANQVEEEGRDPIEATNNAFSWTRWLYSDA